MVESNGFSFWIAGTGCNLELRQHVLTAKGRIIEDMFSSILILTVV